MNSRTLADPPREEAFELPFGVDLGDSYDSHALAAPYQQEFIGGEISLAKADGNDYIITTPGGTMRLSRDIDFGLIPKTKQPSLLKAGAEKVVLSYGLLQHYTVEQAVENFDFEMKPGRDGIEYPDYSKCYAFYRVRCDLVKIGPNGKEYVFTTSYGSANTKEKRNGSNGVFDAANAALKMAQKRALTSAALSISGLSSAFTMDMEAEEFISKNIDELNATKDPNAPITMKQIRLIYAKANNIGLNTVMAKKALKDAGFASVKGITQKEYDAVLELFETPAEKEAREAQRGE